MAIRIGHAVYDENGKAIKGKAGDQTGKEVRIDKYYAGGWEFLLRCKDKQKAEVMAKACEAGCGNENIGYAQDQRNTLRTQAKAVSWNLAKVSTACECDCSSFMTVCAEAAGINVPYSSGNAPTTRTMRNAFKSTGMFDVYSPTIRKLRGDILVKAGSHTIMILDDEAEESAKHFKKYTGASGSIVDSLKSIGEKSAITYRKQIAKVNGISDYSGTAKQNREMLSLLKQGKLIKP